MKERVHIHTLEVSGQGQVINFQVRIPRDAKRIVGILITENAPAGIFAPPIVSPPVILPPNPVSPPIVGAARMAVSFASIPGNDNAMDLAVAASRITFPINVGSVLLQTKNKANFFYQEEVFHNENSFSAGDFTQSAPVPSFSDNSFRALSAFPNIVPGGLPGAFARRNFKGGASYREVCIEIDVQNTKLFGMYTDVFNEQRRFDSTYQVNLYFYYEQKRIISNEN